MWKKYIGKKKLEEKKDDWIFYYLTRSRQRVYGIFIIVYHEQNTILDWDMVDGISEKEEEAKKIVQICKKYLVTPVHMPECLDEIIQKMSGGKELHC